MAQDPSQRSHEELVGSLESGEENWGDQVTNRIFEWGSRAEFRLKGGDTAQQLDAATRALRALLAQPGHAAEAQGFLNLFYLSHESDPSLFSFLVAWKSEEGASAFLKGHEYAEVAAQLAGIATLTRPLEAFRLCSEVSEPVDETDRYYPTSGLSGVIDEWYLKHSKHTQSFEDNRFEWLKTMKTQCPQLRGGIVAWSLDHPEHYQVISGFLAGLAVPQCREEPQAAAQDEAARAFAVGPSTSRWAITRVTSD